MHGAVGLLMPTLSLFTPVLTPYLFLLRLHRLPTWG